MFFTSIPYDVREFLALDVSRKFSCSVVPIVHLAANIGCHKTPVKRVERIQDLHDYTREKIELDSK